MWSASRTVETRCDTMIDVRSRITPAAATGFPPPCRCRPPTARRRGSECAGRSTTARAIAVRCFCPPDSVMPALADHRVVALREIDNVLVEPRDCGRRLDMAYSASRIVPARPAPASPCPAPCPLPHRAPNANCRQACRRTGTAPAGRTRWRPQRRSGMSRTSTPSMKTVPGGGWCSRASRLISVDLPDRSARRAPPSGPPRS